MYLSKCKPSQFNDSCTPRRLGNWEIPRSEFCRSKPGITDCRRTGFTRIIANDKGHLFSTAKKAEGGPWSDYVNSFDMPSKIPGPNTTNPMARTKEQVGILKKKYDEFQKELCSHRGKKSSSKNLKPKVVCCKCGQVVDEGGPNVVVCRCCKIEDNPPPQSAGKDKSKLTENSNEEENNCEKDKSKLTDNNTIEEKKIDENCLSNA